MLKIKWQNLLVKQNLGLKQSFKTQSMSFVRLLIYIFHTGGLRSLVTEEIETWINVR